MVHKNLKIFLVNPLAHNANACLNIRWDYETPLVLTSISDYYTALVIFFFYSACLQLYMV